MSDNRPPIYGKCPAGCEWETVHKADFDASATYLKMKAQAGGIYLCEPLNLYKISTDIESQKYICTISFVYDKAGVSAEYAIQYTEFDAFRNYLYFELLSMSVNDAGTEITIVYEVNGNRYTETITDTSIDISNAKIKFVSATNVFKHNADAEIVGGKDGKDGKDGVDGKDGANGKDGADGKSAYESAVEGGYTDTEAAFNADLAAMQGLASELEGLL